MEKQFIEEAVRLALENVEKYGGEPFGAVIVKNGEIISSGVNEVERDHDPTAHAELLVIRDACQKLNTTDLSDCVLYASGEPCPMCLGAIYWANLKRVYYAYSLHDAEEVGLSSEYIYNQIASRNKEIVYQHVKVPLSLENPLKYWSKKMGKNV
jgi:guanine deaminase